jgi:hypothetical protein
MRAACSALMISSTCNLQPATCNFQPSTFNLQLSQEGGAEFGGMAADTEFAHYVFKG